MSQKDPTKELQEVPESPQEEPVDGRDVATGTSPRLSADTMAGTPRSSSPAPAMVKSYMKPVMPGYHAPTQPSVVIQRTVQVEQVGQTEDNLRNAIPVMQRPLAIACLVFNVISPGLGTFISGMSLLCGSRMRSKQTDLMAGIWLNTWVALFQLLTTLVFFFGWVWSIAWGAAFLSISREYYAKVGDGKSGMTSESHSRNSGTTTTTTTTTTTVALPEQSTSTNQDSESGQNHPIIVLQEAPILIGQQQQEQTHQVALQPIPTFNFCGLNPHNPRHQRIIRRRMTEGEIPSAILTPATIENIVINNVPVPVRTAPNAEEEPAPSFLSK